MAKPYTVSAAKGAEQVMRALSGKNDLNSEMLPDTSEMLLPDRTASSYFFSMQALQELLQDAPQSHQKPGIIAYAMFRQWMQRRCTMLPFDSGMVEETSETLIYRTAMLLVQTMVFAMRVDGQIARPEQQSLREFCVAVFADKQDTINGEIDRLLTIDLEPEMLATQVQFAEESLDTAK